MKLYFPENKQEEWLVLKTCPRCGRTVLLSKFSNSKQSKDGKQGYCKDCFKEIERYRGTEAQKLHSRRSSRKRRIKLLNYLCNDSPKCKACGFSDIRALQVDHIHGGGSKEFKALGNQGIYRKILNLNLKEAKSKYQVLCANCNKLKEGPIKNKDYKRFRLRVLNHVSSGFLNCKYCNETDIEVLCIDHIFGGGNRAFLAKGPYGVYRGILKMKESEVRRYFQVLCRNCNQIKKSTEVRVN